MVSETSRPQEQSICKDDITQCEEANGPLKTKDIPKAQNESNPSHVLPINSAESIQSIVITSSDNSDIEITPSCENTQMEEGNQK